MRAPEIAAVAARVSDEMQDRGVESRDALASGALTAGFLAWGVGTDHVLAHSESPESSDAADALLEILAISMRLENGKERSVLEMLVTNTHRQMVADRFGVRREDDGLADCSLVTLGWRRSCVGAPLGQVDLEAAVCCS